jgi:molybdate transport system ATP-binding protein
VRLEAALRVARGAFTLTLDETLDIAGITAVMGASGSGKTTLLRALCGLEASAQARVVLDGAVLHDTAAGIRLPAHRRGLGHVFQDARLFAHLTVAGNLRYAARRAPRGRPGPHWDAVVEALDLAPLLSRRTHGLSGGERQRVAIARALLAAPRLLLMDEPLAALDLRRKAELLPYIARLPRTFGIPVLYVSHAVEEVAQLAHEVLILTAGRVVARGEVHAVLERPEAEAVSGHFEAGVLLDATVIAHVPQYALTELDLAGQRLRLPHVEAPPGTGVRLRVRSRDVSLALAPVADISVRNQLHARVLAVREEPASAYADVVLALATANGPGDAAHLRARITREAVHTLGLAPGRQVVALVKSVTFDRRVLA